MRLRKPYPRELRAQRVIIKGGDDSYLKLGAVTNAQQGALPAEEGILVNNASIKQINVYVNGTWGGIGAEGGGGISSTPLGGQHEVYDIRLDSGLNPVFEYETVAE